MKRFLVIVAIIFSLLFGLVIFFLSYDLVIYRIWVNIISPHPAQLIIPDLRQFTEIPHNDYYLLKWSDDGTTISLYHSNWTSSTPDLPSTIFYVDVQSGKVIDAFQEVPINSSNQTFHLRNAIRLERDDTEWVKCLRDDVSINLERLEGDTYYLRLLKNDMEIAKFTLSPFYPGFMPGERYISFLAFSPNCNYLTLTFQGWAYYEGESRDELWLLDITNKSIKPIVMGRWPLIRAADYPVQTLYPDWSPDGKRLVFGDDLFGLETYNIETSKLSRLASLGHSGWEPKWSASGQWIAAEQSNKIIILSQNGNFFSLGGKCTSISDFEWSPLNDQLAYLCFDDQTMTDSLWVWDVESSK